MRIVAVSILILASAIACAAVDGPPERPGKAVSSGGAVYTAAARDGQPRPWVELVTLSTGGAGAAHYALPLGISAGAGPLDAAWDLTNNGVVAVSVEEWAPRQRKVEIVRIARAELQPVDGVRAETRGMSALGRGFPAEPLATALVEREIQETGPVFFDVVEGDDGSVWLPILSAGTLTVWEHDGSQWRVRVRQATDVAGPFRAFRVEGALYAWFADGTLVEAGESAMRSVGRVGGAGHDFLVVDRRVRSNLLIPGNDLAAARSVKGGKLEAAGVDQATKVAIESLRREVSGR